VEELHDFSELDFVYALDRLPPASGIARLTFAAINLASAEVAADAELHATIFECSAAFTAGVLLALSLRKADSADVDRMWLSDGASAVKVRGRHAVIAEHCDLSAVAAIEREYAHELTSQIHGLTDEDADRLRGIVVRLFEAGLALGLLA
jgi:hypothetical protein